MGTWGPGILSNDFAVDIKDLWQEALVENDYDEIYVSDAIIKSAKEEGIFEDNDDEYEFWICFALIQWKSGRLQEKVKTKALRYFENDAFEKFEVDKWFETTDYKKRIGYLEKLKSTLNSAQPNRKKYKQPFHQTTMFQPGDVASILLKNGNYVIIKVVNVKTSGEGKYPIVILYNYNSTEEPSIEEIKNCRPIIVRKILNMKVASSENICSQFCYEFDIWAFSEKFSEPVKRIKILSRTGHPGYKLNHSFKMVQWKDIHKEFAEWVLGNIEIIDASKHKKV